MAYVFEGQVAYSTDTNHPVVGGIFVFTLTPGGPAEPITDLNGTPISQLVSGANYMTPSFLHATATRGYLDNGVFPQSILSTAAQDGAAAVVAAQAAATSAANAAQDASNAGTQAGQVAQQAGAILALTDPTSTQNADGTWASSRPVTATGKSVRWKQVVPGSSYPPDTLVQDGDEFIVVGPAPATT